MEHQAKRSNYKNEIRAIILGGTVAYIWQLFCIIIIQLGNRYSSLSWEDFVPKCSTMFTVGALVSWLLFGLLNVTWINSWIQFTIYGFIFLIPFGGTFLITTYIGTPHFLVLSISISAILTPPLIKFFKKIWLTMSTNIIY